MRIKIEKVSGGNVKVSITTDISKKPFTWEGTPEQVRLFVSMLAHAANADTFSFELGL